MEKWDVEQVAEWLSNDVKVREDAISLFKENGIDGEALCEINDGEQLCRLMPTMRIGDAFKIIKRRNKLMNSNRTVLELPNTLMAESASEERMQADQSTCSESNQNSSDHGKTSKTTKGKHERNEKEKTMECNQKDVTQQPSNCTEKSVPLSDETNVNEDLSNTCTCMSIARPFGSKGLNIKYEQGSVLHENGVPLSECASEDFISPAREFKLYRNTAGPNVEPKEALKKFVIEVLRFCSACLNSRFNGTIYFGIADKVIPKDKEHNYQEGEVVGVELPEGVHQKDFEEKLRQEIKNSFEDEKTRDAADKCISVPRFIPVLRSRSTLGNHFIIEVDVEPSSAFVNDLHFVTELPVYECPKQQCSSEAKDKEQKRSSNTKKKEPRIIYLRRSASSCKLQDEERDLFLKSGLSDAIQRRKEAESKHRQNQPHVGNLCEKFRNLMCCGNKLLDSSILPILVIDKPAKEFEERDLNFIHLVKWRAVVDLDADGKAYKLYSKKYSTTKFLVECFDEKVTSHQQLHNVATCWVFANGSTCTHEKSPVEETTKWLQTRKRGMTNLVQELCEITFGRAVVMVLFLSGDTMIMSDICLEFSSYFLTKMFYVAEDESLINNFLTDVYGRIHEEHLKNHCVIGLPLSQVTEVMTSITGPRTPIHCKVPIYTGVPMRIKRKNLKHLYILSVNECENYNVSKQYLNQMRIEEEVKFFRGNLVSWLNIWFSEEKYSPSKCHVLKRNQYQELRDKVNDCLSTSTDNGKHVSEVTLWHQPGAGGSTLARHVLWSFRKDFKCAIIEDISNDTFEDIWTFYKHGESETRRDNIKPVLLVLDDYDDGLATVFVESLHEGIGKKVQLSSSSMPVCVLLWCRKTESTQCITKSSVMLCQKLAEREQDWFEDKHKDLESEQLNPGPEHLLAFQVMRNNFNEDAIRSCVSRYLTSEELKRHETLLLKYIALLNKYYDNSPEIPVSFFDPFMEVYQISSASNWEYSLSNPCMFLLVELAHYSVGSIKAYKIVHPKLASEIFKQLLEKKPQTLSESVLEFLNINSFKSKVKYSKNYLVDLVKNMLTRRKRREFGDSTTTKFSPVMEDIMKNESTEKAIDVLIFGFDILTDRDNQKDPYLAQHIARMCIHDKQFAKAHEYADLAGKLAGRRSFYFDNTKGQVYKEEFQHMWKKMSLMEKFITPEMVTDIVAIGCEAIRWFKQSVAGSRTVSNNNYFGYMGELEVYSTLITILTKLDAFDGETLIKYLVDPPFLPIFLPDTWNNYHELLKNLLNSSRDAYFAVLDALSITTLGENSGDVENKRIGQMEHILWKIEESISHYIPKSQTKESDEIKSYQWRWKVKRIRAGHFGRVMKCARTKNGKFYLLQLRKRLKQCKPICQHEEFDLRTLLLVNVALAGTHETPFSSLEDNYRVCRRLLDMNCQNNLCEQFFILMFMWPLKTMEIEYDHEVFMCALNYMREKREKILPAKKMRSDIEEYKKTGTRPLSYQIRTPFYFGKKSGLQRYVYTDDLDFDHKKYGEFWKEKDIGNRLMRVRGVTSSPSEVMAINYQREGKEFYIPVKVYRNAVPPEQDVDFYLGFSWGGPVAYDIRPYSSNQGTNTKFAKRKVSRDAKSPTALLDSFNFNDF